MTVEEIILAQKLERKKCLDSILQSKASKKLILAGAGTGKTFTFKEVLKVNPVGENLAMTFIRRLSDDMNTSFGDIAEVKTFHAYCKKVMHEQNGKIDLIPFLTKIIEEDASYLRKNLNDFEKRFQMLEEESAEIAFYLKRGDYYDSVSFNDSVYRLYKTLQVNPEVVPIFNQILIDEYQDFNPLEVAFINELEKRGNILIVGDDDQAVYDGRSASPEHLRAKFNSGDYKIFELPFCSRCTEVIVKAANAFFSNAEIKGFLKGRVKKRYECFVDLKGKDSVRFPTIITAQCSLGKTAAKYVDKIIEAIEATDIEESWKEGVEFYTVLIIGPKQYLSIIQKILGDKYPQMTYKVNEEKLLNVIDGYDILLKDIEANLGWRIIINFYFKDNVIRVVIEESENEKNIIDILEKDFVTRQKRAIEIIRMIKKGEQIDEELKTELRQIITIFYDEIMGYYTPVEKQEEEKSDKSKPSILLSSFVGCKGLSGGHVIIIGANDGAIPKDSKNIKDVEIAQFMVALTRTRKQCHIVSNQWHIAPILGGVFQTKYKKSCFLDWIPKEFIDDKGLLSAKEIK